MCKIIMIYRQQIHIMFGFSVLICTEVVFNEQKSWYEKPHITSVNAVFLFVYGGLIAQKYSPRMELQVILLYLRIPFSEMKQLLRLCSTP